jgi:predicted MFS family arabinose efflux permease
MPAWSAGTRGGPAGWQPGGLASRDFVLLLVSAVGTFTNYAPLLSVVPMWAVRGGAASGGAGAATGVTMATTVVIQFCMPRLQSRFRLRTILAIGCLVLGVPTFGYTLSSSVGWVLMISAVRGVGFGMVAVAGSALAAALVPASHRGRAVGWYGMAVGLPQLACLPIGVWAARHVGFNTVFIATGAACIAAFPLVLAMRPGDRAHRQPASGRWGAGLLRCLAPPWLLLIAVASAFGGITAFVPLMPAASGIAPVSLFLMSATGMAGRWGAGMRSDRAGRGHLLVSSMVACVLGLAGLAASAAVSSPLLTLSATAVYGLGFGALQNDTLVVMFRRAGPDGHGAASTVWNLAFDAGTGLGATAIGWGSDALGLGGAYAVSAAVIAAIAPVAFGTRAREHVAQDSERAPATSP